MIINKNSFHYKMYKFFHIFFDITLSEQTNLCRYVLIIIALPIMMLFLLCLALIGLPVLAAAFIIYNMFIAIFGFYHFDLSESEKNYPGLPIFGFKMYPYHLVLLWLFIKFNIYAIHRHLLLIPITFSVIISSILFYMLANKKTLSYLSDKKKKICPTINFEESDE